MSKLQGVMCDRCGSTAVKRSKDWGIVRLTRSKQFLDTDTKDLCPPCTDHVYDALKKPKPRPDCPNCGKKESDDDHWVDDGPNRSGWGCPR